MNKGIICNFLEKQVIGKSLETNETIYYLEDGKLEGFYSDEMFFSDLLVSPNGFQFNMTTVAREKIYVVDSNKNRGDIKKDFTGVSVFRYEIAERKSTSQLTGVMRLLSSTVPEQTMEGVVYGVYDFELESSQLRWKEQQLLYRDMPTENNYFRAVAFDANIRLYVENKKLKFEYVPTYFDVNTKTLQKTLSKNQYPLFLAKEI